MLRATILTSDCSADPWVPAPGQIIGNNYEVIGEIGRGAMGIVVLATDKRLKRKVAIKLIQTTLQTAHFRERFLREARAMAEVSHPNILDIYAFGMHKSIPYFVMQYVDGTTLDNLLATHGRAMDIHFALRILKGICAGVQAMHDSKTVHRDLKPANILLDANMHVRVADFGMAQKYIGSEAIPEFVGTPGFIAPELGLEGRKATLASPRSDVYSLGCIAYELLTGRAPFEADSEDALMTLHAIAEAAPPSSVRPDLPSTFDTALLNALAKDPERRTQSAALLQWNLRSAFSKSLVPNRILIADDDADFRALVEGRLRMEFPYAEVECVGDGQATLAAFDRNPASVVILDLCMPILDGMAATVLLRGRPTTAKVPILVLTALGGSHEWRCLSSLGADRLLVKPVDLDDVVALVRRTLRERLGRAEPSSNSAHGS